LDAYILISITKLLIFIVLSLSVACSIAEEVTVFTDGVCYDVETLLKPNERVITLNATDFEINSKKVSPGHAYITVTEPTEGKQESIFDEPINACFNPKTEGFGQNPSTNTTKKSIFSMFFNGDKDGGVINQDLSKLDPQDSINVRIDIAKLWEVNLLINKWKSTPYHLKDANCIDFMIEIAKVIGLSEVPNKRTYELPLSYMKRLMLANKHVSI
jgi:hypothetical protein